MPIKYVPFIPEPIEGQAVLGNFNRILTYKGSDETSMVLERGMPLYEIEKALGPCTQVRNPKAFSFY